MAFRLKGSQFYSLWSFLSQQPSQFPYLPEDHQPRLWALHQPRTCYIDHPSDQPIPCDDHRIGGVQLFAGIFFPLPSSKDIHPISFHIGKDLVDIENDDPIKEELGAIEALRFIGFIPFDFGRLSIAVVEELVQVYLEKEV